MAYSFWFIKKQNDAVDAEGRARDDNNEKANKANETVTAEANTCTVR